MASEKFSLKWNDYQSNWSQSLSGLRNDIELADVTLITDDKVKIFAHKILLSSCSEVFKFILSDSKLQSPMLYLSGMSSVNLGFILDYIYYGEVNLFQEQLDSFLENAQKLEIEGLLGDNKEQIQQEQDTSWHNDKINASQEIDVKNIINQQSMDEEKRMAKVVDNDMVIRPRHYNRGLSSSNHVDKFDVGSMTAEEIEMKKIELYQKIDGVWSCMACSYTTTRNDNMRKHVETHLDGLSYTCTLCNKDFRSKDSLINHKYRIHK